ncbi:MAG: hypothetical protein A3K19_30105 [Lentisphaerae bacterium RIFOXYB12_FULL_65_16]|nr:MAG: hypothetical protein A3K18_18900 [Lentisphaerae bacterium RIFOXYA12_64_32]OGV85754.1 MAG: hypothetical protein A3K19_30105 [Lentisphaerae bacterium RIFOXYB12_FULL_65_16]
MAEFTQNVVVADAQGLHARVAAVVVREANRFDARIRVRLGNREVDGKSILGLLVLGASRGAELTVTGQGVDAPDAVRRIADVLRPAGGRNGDVCASSPRLMAPLGVGAGLYAAR